MSRVLHLHSSACHLWHRALLPLLQQLLLRHLHLVGPPECGEYIPNRVSLALFLSPPGLLRWNALPLRLRLQRPAPIRAPLTERHEAVSVRRLNPAVVAENGHLLQVALEDSEWPTAILILLFGKCSSFPGIPGTSTS